MSIELKRLSSSGDEEHRVNGVENPGFVRDDVEYNELAVQKDNDDERSGNKCSRGVGYVQSGVTSFYTKHSRTIWTAIGFILLAAYIAYFGYALYYRFGDEGSYRLLGATIFGAVVFLWSLGGHHVVVILKKRYQSIVADVGQSRCLSVRKLIRWSLYVAMAVFICVYTGVKIGRENPRNLVSLSGIAAFILIMYITSIDPSRVNWHPVFWGMAIQYVFACLILETYWGYAAFKWLGDRMTEILAYSNTGAKFVFGDNYEDHLFAFKVLPVIIYFSSLISILYYLGVMQSIIQVLGRFLAFCLDTTATESLNAAGNIFAGQTESPLMIRPFLPVMTKSEIHAVMVGGFATVSGSVLGAYVSYGVQANHLLSASVMSAPAALAISKLTYPETEKSDVNPQDVYKRQTGSTRNAIEAASEGASVAIKLVANVAVNVMAFLALLELVNTSLIWFGERAGVEGLTFQNVQLENLERTIFPSFASAGKTVCFSSERCGGSRVVSSKYRLSEKKVAFNTSAASWFICSYVFYPISYLMGVETVDCRRVAKLLGFKTFTNEFVAYVKMGDLIDNGHIFTNYTTQNPGANWTVSGDDIYLTDWDKTLVGGYLLPRSQVIATYALCGFSNLSSMGIQIGGLGAMAPSRKTDLTSLALRAMIAGNVACFLTACIAGLFYTEDM